MAFTKTQYNLSSDSMREMRRKHPRIIGLLAVMGIGVLVLVFFLVIEILVPVKLSLEEQPVIPKLISSVQPEVTLADSCLQAIIDGVRFLDTQIQENGQFVYRVNLDPEVKIKPKYNLLRHSGTIYALADAAASIPQLRQDQELHSHFKNCATFIKTQTLAPVPDTTGMLAVWSTPEITHGSGSRQAKLGGVGLALVALCSLERLSPGTTPLDTLQAMGRFITYMQKEDGSFYSKFYPDGIGRSDTWTSLYYPGEAALGLIMLYELDQDPKWLASAVDVLKFLALSRIGKSRPKPDHWALIATSRVWPFLDANAFLQAKQVLLLNHAEQVSSRMLADIPRRMPGAGRGAMLPDGRIAPQGTRLEGMLAMVPIFGELKPDLEVQIEKHTPASIRFLLSGQVADGVYKGGFTRVHPNYYPLARRGGKSKTREMTELRIDVTQHSISALLTYLRNSHPDILAAQS